MATGTNGIATQLDANTLHINATGAANGPYTDSTQMNRCITYSSAISAGFKVNNADRYTSNTNRLVRYSDLAPGINTFRFRFAINSIDDDARNIGISFNCTLYTSTGEAIGYDKKLYRAFYKALQASGMKLQNFGTVFVTVADKDKNEALELIKRFYKLGFNIVATEGTSKFLKENNVKNRILKKFKDNSNDIADLLRTGFVSYVINTSELGVEDLDGTKIRALSIETNTPLFTALDTVRVVLDVLEETTLSISTIDSK